MNDLATIESYLNGQMTNAERVAFEASLRTDTALADTLAFYVMAKHSAKVAAREQRHAEWEVRRRTVAQPARPLHRIGQWAYPLAAAACLMLALGFGWYFINKPTAPELADAYINEHLITLSVTMDGQADSLQTGIQRYNNGNLAEADALFGALLRQNPDNVEALKFAGLVSLRRGNYDQAIEQFHRLSQRADLYDNPGLFYEALARLKRNRPNDKSQAQELLKSLITKNLSNKAEAEKLLHDL